ncbi:ABC transporter G family member 31 (ABC transporter ABCG.31) (AtABCG31) (Pleiotropic drug resistance protein 3) (AtPDR3) [Durusdinium trenchii]|uniref:ABC transporter G family member 31 (ABC transporter ABCG.31) (AtABCG31) (Pleiotropic drug resistance protein 3) (AtPDR3) n=1 Tax=Durusdinium trenchii TaxID=1381693 RepID=A0ABP0PNT4_9DINO
MNCRLSDDSNARGRPAFREKCRRPRSAAFRGKHEVRHCVRDPASACGVRPGHPYLRERRARPPGDHRQTVKLRRRSADQEQHGESMLAQDGKGGEGAAAASGGPTGLPTRPAEGDVDLESSTSAGALSEKGAAKSGRAGDDAPQDGAGGAEKSDRMTQDEVTQVRALLGRLQVQCAQAADGDGQAFQVSLNKDEVELLGHLFGRGLLRAPSNIQRSAMAQLHEQLSATEFASLLSRTRGGNFWQVDVGFKDLTYTVKATPGSGGIATVGNQFYQLIAPCVRAVKGLSSAKEDIHLLRNISGSFNAGVPTLVLGPPGCGVTTMCKVLSGRAKLNKNHVQSGTTLYSGFDATEVDPRRVATYVDQVDQHIAVLTVTETAEFANACFGGLKQMSKHAFTADTPESEKEQVLKVLENFPAYMIDKFALTNCKDTIVGDDLVRGVSGGERKRVTSVEMLMSQRPLSFFDQISTGLDSAATFDICRRLTGMSRSLATTVVIALLQPPPEVYELFDEVMILAAGHVVFHSKRENVLPYFESIGFRCPRNRDIADFIQEVTTDMRAKYQFKSDAPKSESEMAQAWLNSPFSDEKQTEIQRFTDSANKRDHLLREKIYAKQAPKFATTFMTDFKLVLERQRKLVMRDPAFTGARIGQAVVMGTIIGTTFVKIDGNIPPEPNGNVAGVTQRYGLIFATMLQSMLTGMATIPVVLAQRDVFYKQSKAGFHRTLTLVMSEYIVSLPIQILESVVFSTLVFWIAQIVPFSDNSTTGEGAGGAVDTFFVLILFMVVLDISYGGFLRAIAALSPNEPIAQLFGGVLIAFCVLFSGFVITFDNIPDWFIWIYWLTPLSWGVRSVVIQVFQEDAFTPEQSEFALDLFAFQTDRAFIWGGLGLLIGYTFVNAALSLAAYKLLDFSGAGQGQGTPSSSAAGLTFDADSDREVIQRELSKVLARELSQQITTSDAAGNPADGAVLHVKSLARVSQPVNIVWRDLWYSVPNPQHKESSIDLLKGVSGMAEAGSMVALMGPSGAGKSTLLDVIASRKTSGSIKGEILVNGRPKDDAAFSRVTGYVEQQDLHSPHATVEEALVFAAMLRQPESVPESEKLDFVESVISMLELNIIRDFEIGFKTDGGLSVEQAKRLTIGVELCANPSVLFADEPTSGLDARGAVLVMRGIRRVAESGRAVICTIHQPSRDVFENFDRLLLLRRGGEVVYFGDLGKDSSILLAYLQAIPGTPPMRNARYNPATYMLEVTGSATGGVIDYADEYRASDLIVKNEAFFQEKVDQDLATKDEILFESEYAASYATQQKMLLRRWVKTYWRSPNYNLARLLFVIFMALVFGFSFFLEGKTIDRTSLAQSLMGVIFLTALFVGYVYVNTTIPVVFSERASLYRERASKTYGITPYIIAFTLAEIPYLVVTTLLFVSIFYFLVGLWANAGVFFQFWFIFFIYLTSMTFFGQMLAVLSPNQQVATLLGSAATGLMALYAGFYISVDDVPAFWSFMTYINPARYVLNGLVVTVLNCDDFIEDQGSPGCGTLSGDGLSITTWEYISETFGFAADDIGADIGALVGFVVAFRLIAAYGLTYISHLTR